VSQASETAAEITVPRPDDWHVHLRDDAMLAAVAPFTAQWFRKALVMPNLVPPITSTQSARQYRQRIIDAVSASGTPIAEFEPVMALYVAPNIDRLDLLAGVQEGIVGALKYYPAGATTNSDSGGTRMADFLDLFGFMAEHQIPLAVHAESTDPAIDVYDREQVFIETELAAVVNLVPDLRVTLEHISTRAGIEFVAANQQVAGTITPHHLACDRYDLLANGLRPDLYCKPILNSPDDRKALVAGATSGTPRLFLGTDSAPHPSSQKYSAKVSAGVFSAPYALQVVAEVFYQNDALDQLSGFVSANGIAHYRAEPPVSSVRLARSAKDPDEMMAESCIVTKDGDEVTVFGVGEADVWSMTAVR